MKKERPGMYAYTDNDYAPDSVSKVERYRRYIRSRSPHCPTPGVIYESVCGGVFLCIDSNYEAESAQFLNIVTGWAFRAHQIGMYSDAKIDWEFTTGGRYVESVTITFEEESE